MNIIKYTTAVADNIEELDDKVNVLIRDGFQPYGNPYYIAPSDRVVDSPVCQAMVRTGTPHHQIGEDEEIVPDAARPVG